MEVASVKEETCVLVLNKNPDAPAGIHGLVLREFPIAGCLE